MLTQENAVSIMVTVEKLSKRFGRITALEEVSFKIPSGAVVGLLGVNGAGKTTLMRILAGYLSPSAGYVRITDNARPELPAEARRRIGYMPENTPLYSEMRVGEYLRFRGRIKGLSGRRLRGRIAHVLGQCDLEDVSRRLIGRLSRGYRQRLGLADALLHEPELLVLDEPIANLDPNQRRALHTLIARQRGKNTVLLSSHILTDVESLCEQVIILHKGRVAVDGSPAALREGTLGRRVIEAEVRHGQAGLPAAYMAALERRLGADCSEVSATPLDDGYMRVRCVTGAEIDPRETLFAWAVESGIVLRELRLHRQSLDAVFSALTECAGASNPRADPPELNGDEDVDDLEP